MDAYEYCSAYMMNFPVDVEIGMRFVGNVRPTGADVEKIVAQIARRTGVTVCPDGGDAHIHGNEARRQNGPDPFDIDAIHKAMQIISLCVEPCPRGSKRIYSGEKHTCEELITPIRYITNGGFIVAMELCGYHSVWPKKRRGNLHTFILGKWNEEMLALIRYRGIHFASPATAKENASGIVTVEDTSNFDVAMAVAKKGRGKYYFNLEVEFGLSFRDGHGPTEDDIARRAIHLKSNPKFTRVPSNRLNAIREAMQIIALCVPWCARMPRKRIQSGKGKHTCERFMSGGHVGEHEFTLAMELREILLSHARLYNVKFRGAWNESLLALLHRRYIYYCSTRSKLLLASVIFTTRADWRPVLHGTFPPRVREGVRTILVLRKARDTKKSTEKMMYARYPSACLCLLPEELMQYLFIYVCSIPNKIAL